MGFNPCSPSQRPRYFKGPKPYSCQSFKGLGSATTPDIPETPRTPNKCKSQKPTCCKSISPADRPHITTTSILHPIFCYNKKSSQSDPARSFRENRAAVQEVSCCARCMLNSRRSSLRRSIQPPRIIHLTTYSFSLRKYVAITLACGKERTSGVYKVYHCHGMVHQ